MISIIVSVALSFTMFTLNAVISGPTSGSGSEYGASSDGKFVHTVFFWLNNPDSDDDRQALYEGLQMLKEIEEIEQAFIGVPAPTDRPVIDNTYSFSITFIFADQAHQDVYQDHPIHLRFIEEYSHLWDRVLVYDAVRPEM